MNYSRFLPQARGTLHEYRATALALAFIASIFVASPQARADFVLDDATAEPQQQPQFNAPPAVAGQVSDAGEVQSEAPLRESAPAATVPPPPKPAEVWSLTEGKLVGQELARWGQRAGWKVVWQLASNRDIVVPANTSFEGDFQTAAADVIATLAANGVIIRTKFYEGNRTMVVTGAGTTPQ